MLEPATDLTASTAAMRPGREEWNQRTTRMDPTGAKHWLHPLGKQQPAAHLAENAVAMEPQALDSREQDDEEERPTSLEEPPRSQVQTPNGSLCCC